VGYDDDLLLSGLLNSLAIVRLVTFMQEHFGLDIPAEDVVIEHFQSIDAVATYVQTRKSQVMAK
jgi:acyl carrier protein